MAGTNTQHYCISCGERIGVYEPIWLQHADGTVANTSLLNLDDEHVRGEHSPRLFHLGCLVPNEIPRMHAG